jgi:hypothetical protein
MSKRERLLTNKKARESAESELTQILRDFLIETTGSAPSAAQEGGLREAAPWIREGTITWSQVEGAIAGQTWDPAEGPRAILGPS